MTAEQRRQSIDFGKTYGTGMPIPAGITSAPWRTHSVNSYFEVPLSGSFVFWRNQRPPVSIWGNQVIPPDGSTQII